MPLLSPELNVDGRPEGAPNDPGLLYPFDVALASVEERIGIRQGVPYYDRKGTPISVARWARLHEVGDPEYGPTALDYIVVGRTAIGQYEVSTAWIGIDHAWGRGVPLIFETMVFPQEGAPEWESVDNFMDRYPTEDSAVRGHLEVVTLLRLTYPDQVNPPMTHELGIANPLERNL